MNPKKMVLKEKIIGSVLVLVLFALSFFFVIQPRLAAPEKINQETAAERGKLSGLKAQEVQLREKEKTAPGKQAAAQSIADKFPPTADVPELTTLIQNTGAASGINPGSINVTVSKQEVFTPSGAAASSGGGAPAASAPAPAAAADPAAGASAAPTAPTSSSGETIYRMLITIKVENASLDQIGAYTVNLSNASRAVYTLSVNSSGAATGTASTAPAAAANSAGIPAGSGSYNHEIEAVTFLLPPLTIQPPPVVSSTPSGG